MLLGYAFESVRVHPTTGSFAASVISDLAAFLGDKDLYSNIVNDLKATGIIPLYWQVPDTRSLFMLEGKDIITYPRVDYADDLVPFDTYAFAGHVQHEPQSFGITQHIGSSGLMLMMLLLRDRYFPTLWSSLVSNTEGTHKNNCG